MSTDELRLLVLRMLEHDGAKRMSRYVRLTNLRDFMDGRRPAPPALLKFLKLRKVKTVVYEHEEIELEPVTDTGGVVPGTARTATQRRG